MLVRENELEGQAQIWAFAYVYIQYCTVGIEKRIPAKNTLAVCIKGTV